VVPCRLPATGANIVHLNVALALQWATPSMSINSNYNAVFSRLSVSFWSWHFHSTRPITYVQQFGILTSNDAECSLKNFENRWFRSPLRHLYTKRPPLVKVRHTGVCGIGGLAVGISVSAQMLVWSTLRSGGSRRPARLAGLAYAILGSSGEQQYVARYRPSSPFVTSA
jgi:hypothetical protein